MAELILERLTIRYPRPTGAVLAVRDLSLSVSDGECLGVVGESGAGKSQAFLAALGLTPPQARITGEARLGALNLLRMRRADLNRVRGSQVAMIFQDPMTALTPHLRVGEQIAESIVQHRGASWSEARARAARLLDRVHIADASRRLTQYPHELSGGMRQRVMIAIALSCDPTLLIADEPTTALDVTIQAQILALLAEIKRDRGMSIVLITHDLGVVAGLADRVVVMHAGSVVESGPVRALLTAPQHPHTQRLLEATPKLEPSSVRSSHAGEPIMRVIGLSVRFQKRLRALDAVSFDIQAGEALGIVGESGSGKSTLARAALQLIRPWAGQVVWLGRSLHELSAAELRPLRRDLQIIFQDPLASLDPRMSVLDIVAEPLRIHCPELARQAREAQAHEMLARVGLPHDAARRFPHEFSGGQCQRIGIARAMMLRPKLLVCDEPVSALDVLVQAQILQLLADLRREHGTSILFISHNLAVVERVCDRVLVLYLGKRMELARADLLFAQPAHPYTRALLAAVPVPDPDIQPVRLKRTLDGDLPSPLSPPQGCVFHTRCPHAIDICRVEQPAWEAVREGSQVACHRWKALQATAMLPA